MEKSTWITTIEDGEEIIGLGTYMRVPKWTISINSVSSMIGRYGPILSKHSRH